MISKCISLRLPLAHSGPSESQTAKQEWGKPDYLHPLNGDWGVETLFAAFHTKGGRVDLSDVQEHPLSIDEVESQRPSHAICLFGLLAVDNIHLGYRPGGGGRHWVAIRRAGNACAFRSLVLFLILTSQRNAPPWRRWEVVATS